MHLYLIRHGQSYVNLKSWNKGNTDEGLTAQGQMQAQALRDRIPEEVSAVDIIYVSTMRRAQETAAIVAQAYECEIHPDDRLREIGNNRSDHSPWPSNSLPADYADYWATERPFASITPTYTNGETLMHFRTRVGLFIEEIVERHHGQTVLCVSHGGVIEFVFDHIFNIGPWRRCEVWDHNTGVTHFEYVEHPGRETWRLHYHNRIAHLYGLGADEDVAEHGTPIQSDQ